MKSIKENIINEYIVNKSKFITLLIKVNDIDDINKNIQQIKNKYKDATHYCYAYIINNIKRFNDDGEPSGTAGMPILNVLENNELTNILCVVVRYFGGIKLGAGGLVRAYTKSVTESLTKTDIVNLKEGFKIIIEFPYNEIKIINNLLKDIEIIDKKFDELVTYSFLIDKEKYENIKDCLNVIKKENILITY